MIEHKVKLKKSVKIILGVLAVGIFLNAFAQIGMKGKNVIELSSKAALEPTPRNIKKAVKNGEFDRLLEE